MSYRRGHRITVYETPDMRYIIGFGTKKEAEMAKWELHQLKKKYPKGKEVGTFSDEEFFRRFARDQK
jgi:hypothetical protein